PRTILGKLQQKSWTPRRPESHPRKPEPSNQRPGAQTLRPAPSAVRPGAQNHAQTPKFSLRHAQA
ncbi:hypothetical protein PIB30_104493, partial [Stylosanthes scabra]|nr:hypothetical protein [Stylosanthes scabra]